MKIECYNYMHSGDNDHIANVMRVNQASIHQWPWNYEAYGVENLDNTQKNFYDINYIMEMRNFSNMKM